MKKGKKMRKGVRIFVCTVLAIALLGICLVLGVNLWVCGSTKGRILSEKKAAELQDVDCILVLGCQVRSDGTPSNMLEDRLKMGVSLYRSGAAPKLLMSGDHGTQYYNEVEAMKRYALEAGVPAEDVVLDHAGFSTYESINRAIRIYGADKIIVVTQKYHLYRALYIAKAMGIEAYGVAADYRQHSNQLNRDVREVLARLKDFGLSIWKPEPAYLGEKIPIDGDGTLTHDRSAIYEE